MTALNHIVYYCANRWSCNVSSFEHGLDQQVKKQLYIILREQEQTPSFHYRNLSNMRSRLKVHLSRKNNVTAIIRLNKYIHTREPTRVLFTPTPVGSLMCKYPI